MATEALLVASASGRKKEEDEGDFCVMQGNSLSLKLYKRVTLTGF